MKTQTAPAPLQGRGPTYLEGAVSLGLGAMLAVLIVAGASRPPRERDRAVADIWRGSGDMSTEWARAEQGMHVIEWDAPCVLDVDLWRRYNVEDVFVMTAGVGTSGKRYVTLDAGNYFLSVGASCDWTAAIH